MAFSKALYFTALIPPEEVKDEIRDLKLEIQDKFHAAHALKLPAHITITPPVWLEAKKEQDFLFLLKKITATEVSFPLELRDFGHFGQRVIFVKVVDHEPVKQLFKNVSEGLDSIFSEAAGSSIHPHITLATRDLDKEKFQKAWKEFSSRSYSNSFSAEALFVLRHNGKTWDIIEKFPFQGNSVSGI